MSFAFRGKNYAYIRRAIVFNLMADSYRNHISKRITSIPRYTKICILVSVKMIYASESGEREGGKGERQTDTRHVVRQLANRAPKK
jgi:hypothetical protein